MANITPQLVDEDGLNPIVFTAATGAGDSIISPGDGVVLHVSNADASPHDVKINDPRSRTPEGATAYDPDVTIVVAAGARAAVWLPSNRFANPATGNIDLSYPGSDVTAVTVAALAIDR